MSMSKEFQWTREMYAYLAWRLFERMYGATEWYEEEAKRIKTYIAEARNAIDDDLRNVVDNRAIRLANEYEKHALYILEKSFWHELHDDDAEFIRAPIEYDQRWYQIWSDAVRKRHTVWMTYDSQTSGRSERLVDPYQTSAPYAKGFCHTTKEIRTFRFDRIIDIVATDQKFEKPANWQELAKQQVSDSLDQELKRIIK